MNTTQNNKLIAEFMGLSYSEKYLYEGWYKNKEHNERICDFNGLKYHKDWNWLMEVVDKIEMMKFPTNNHKMTTSANYTLQSEYRTKGWKSYWFTFTFKDNILVFLRDGKNEEEEPYFETKIKAVYLAVVEFIKWYNEREKEK